MDAPVLSILMKRSKSKNGLPRQCAHWRNDMVFQQSEEPPGHRPREFITGFDSQLLTSTMKLAVLPEPS